MLEKNNIFETEVNFLSRFLSVIKSIFLNGLLTLLPLALTIALFLFFFRLLQSWLGPIHNLLPTMFEKVPGSEIILALIFIFSIGAILKFFLLHSLINFFESILSKIPLIRPVYFGIKQLIHALTFQDEMTFKKVVLVQFPRPGFYSIGFVTNEPASELAPKAEGRFFHVYIPTTPNPTTGYLVFVPEHELKTINLTRQEAMTLIISGGIIQPERFIKK